MIDNFVSIITLPTFAILLRLTCSRSDMIGSFVLLLGEILFLSKNFLFLSHVQVFTKEILFISRLKNPIELYFFPFLFPIYCHSVVHHYVSIVSHDCNQSSFGLFYVVLESLYRCLQHCLQWWQVCFLPPFLIHIVCQLRLWDVMPYSCSLVFLFFGPFA